MSFYDYDDDYSMNWLNILHCLHVCLRWLLHFFLISTISLYIFAMQFLTAINLVATHFPSCNKNRNKTFFEQVIIRGKKKPTHTHTLEIAIIF